MSQHRQQPATQQGDAQGNESEDGKPDKDDASADARAVSDGEAWGPGLSAGSESVTSGH